MASSLYDFNTQQAQGDHPRRKPDIGYDQDNLSFDLNDEPLCDDLKFPGSAIFDPQV